MKMTNLAASAIVAGAFCAGCAKEEKGDTSMKTSTPMASPTTMPTATATMTTPTPAMTEKDMTHVVMTDEAFYAGSPAQGKAPEGTLKAGTKVMLMMPRGSYSQVMTADGKGVYIRTSGLKPVGK